MKKRHSAIIALFGVLAFPETFGDGCLKSSLCRLCLLHMAAYFSDRLKISDQSCLLNKPVGWSN